MAEYIAYVAVAFTVDAVGSLLAPDTPELSAPKIPEAKPLAASEGSPIYYHMGRRNSVPGTVIFVSDIDETQNSKQVGDGKGAQSVPYVTRTADIVVSFGRAVSNRGKAQDIVKCWAASELIYKSSDPSDGDNLWGQFQAVKAGSGQTPSSILTAHKPNAPAFKGSNYIAIKDLLLTAKGTPWGGRIPATFRGLIQSDVDEFTVSDGLVALADLVGEGVNSRFDSDNIDVSLVTGTRLVTADSDYVDGQLEGYQWSGLKEARSIFRDLMLAYDLTARTNGDVVEFLDRGAEDIVEIDPDDLAVVEIGEGARDSDPIQFTDDAGLRLPSEVSIRYYDPKTKWQRGGQTVIRKGAPYENPVSIDLEMTLPTKWAKKIARRVLHVPYRERKKAALRLPPKYAHIQETDILAVIYDGQRYYISVRLLTQGDDYTLEIEGVVIAQQTGTDDLYTASDIVALWADADDDEDDEDADVGDVDDEGFYSPPTMVQKILDIPALYDSETQHPGIRFAHTTLLPAASFQGSTLYRSKNGGDYTAVTSDSDNALNYDVLHTMGTTYDSLGDGLLAATNSRIDTENTITVDLYRSDDVLTSADSTGIADGRNLCLIGEEVVQFMTVSQPDSVTYPRRWTLSNLLRGLRNTEDHSTSHGTGEQFVMLDPFPIIIYKGLNFLDKVFAYKDVPDAFVPDDVGSSVVHINYGERLRPFSPSWVRAARWSEFASNPFVTGANRLYDTFVAESAVNPDDLLWVWDFRTRLPSWGLNEQWKDPPHDPNDGNERYTIRLYDDSMTLKLTKNLPTDQRYYFISEADALSLYGITGGDAVTLEIRQRSIKVSGDGTNSYTNEGNATTLTIPAV